MVMSQQLHMGHVTAGCDSRGGLDFLLDRCVCLSVWILWVWRLRSNNRYRYISNMQQFNLCVPRVAACMKLYVMGHLADRTKTGKAHVLRGGP